jgi:hypothetical protein
MNLASEAEELYVKTALIEMASDFDDLAEKLDQREVRQHLGLRTTQR